MALEELSGVITLFDQPPIVFELSAQSLVMCWWSLASG